MEIQQIRYIEAISKYGNFSKAAEHLYVTQPTLSQQVKRLEDEIGFPLFIRSTRTVSLTDEGKVFLQFAAPLLAAYDALVHEIGQLREHQGYTLQLGILPTFSHLNVLEMIQKFQAQNPDISINLQIEMSNGLLKMLLNGQIDLAIANISKNQMESLEQKLAVRVFSHDRIHALVNASHPLSVKTAIGLSDLASEPLVMLNQNSSIRNQIDLAFQQAGISPTVVYDCPDLHSLMGMLQSNIGVSFLSSRVAGQYIQSPILSIPLEPEIETQTAAIYLEWSSKSDVLERFANFLERELLLL